VPQVPQWHYAPAPRLNMFVRGEFYERNAGCMKGVEDVDAGMGCTQAAYDRMHYAGCISLRSYSSSNLVQGEHPKIRVK